MSFVWNHFHLIAICSKPFTDQSNFYRIFCFLRLERKARKLVCLAFAFFRNGKDFNQTIGGGTGGPHVPRSLNFYFLGCLAPHFKISIFA